MQSIQGKTCLNQTKAWSQIWTVPSLTRLPSQSLSSTHRLDLTASTNAQFASSTCTPPSQRFFFNAKKPLTLGRLQLPDTYRFATVGNLSRAFQTDVRVRWVNRGSSLGLSRQTQGQQYRLVCSDRSVERCLFFFFLALSKTAANVMREPILLLQYVVYMYCCRPFVTSCKSCST